MVSDCPSCQAAILFYTGHWILRLSKSTIWNKYKKELLITILCSKGKTKFTVHIVFAWKPLMFQNYWVDLWVSATSEIFWCLSLPSEQVSEIWKRIGFSQQRIYVNFKAEEGWKTVVEGGGRKEEQTLYFSKICVQLLNFKTWQHMAFLWHNNQRTYITVAGKQTCNKSKCNKSMKDLLGVKHNSRVMQGLHFPSQW